MKFKNKKLEVLYFVIVSIFLPTYFIYASDLTSTNFIIRDPVVGASGGYGTSSNFKLYGSGDLTATGEGSSANFIDRLGFQYYPYVLSGTLDATLDGSDADLTWSATSTALGYNVSGYEVGIASVTGGPYTYTAVGNVLLYSYTNLNPGDYFFVVRTLDGLSNPITISNEDTLTVPAVISFSISDNTIGFSTISSSSARFATGDASGSTTDTSAHNLQVTTNAPNGYSISYSGTSFTGPETITEATITNDSDGSQNTKQFALAFSTDGGATITSSYDHDPAPANRDWKYTASTSELIVTQSSPTALQTISAYYLANVASLTSAGTYGGVITYIATSNF